MQQISLYDALYSQWAVRHFSDRPVSDEAVQTILDAAIRAPNGGNRQLWRFLVIRNAETKRRLGQWYSDSWTHMIDNMTPEERATQPYRSGGDLGNGMAKVPVLMLVCVEHPNGPPATAHISRGASIYPAVQNLMLAAEALGLGTVITTLHTRFEKEIKEYLGMPANSETAALIPLGYPAEDVRRVRTRRFPVADVTFYDRWGHKKAS
ncbi:MAG: nitroreductase family protein [Chloroflexi bacterium]|nr:nitroreductase family protein [Chloroflexota bacterium]